MNPLKQLEQHGQAVWLDFVQRSLIEKGGLKKLIEEDGLRGVTSNPSIFEKAIGGSDEYDDNVREVEDKEDADAMLLFEHLAIKDIRAAADVLRPVYEATRKQDGYISLEVSPYIALDTEQTIADARRLWKWVDRENLMIKVPATPAGIPAIRTLIGDGININVTLLFSQTVYEDVAEAYISGLEALKKNGGDVSRMASVASFFISRIDVMVDKLAEEKLGTAKTEEKPELQAILGKVAIANARLTYQSYKKIYSGARWEALAAAGAKPQRLLWASTGTKNKNYPDTLYVDELIGPDTVNTMPPATMDAFRDHGTAASTIEKDLDGAHKVMESLPKFGITMEEVTKKLVEEGVQLFADAADKLMGAVEHKRDLVLGDRLNVLELRLPKQLQDAVDEKCEEWRAAGKIRRLWAHDASLWTGADEGKWLGWLDIVKQQRDTLEHLTKLADEVKAEGFGHVLLLGMGGSSLGPEVFAETFGRQPGFPELLVLDSTDPAQIRAFEKRIDVSKTLFIVSSKSGGTLEPNIFKQYFFTRAKEVLGDKAGQHFIAITDPGSKMEEVAKRDGFRHIFYGLKTIGGRYSVLSDFGMVPAAAMGVDVEAFLTSTAEMVFSCSQNVPPKQNPGVLLGLTLGTAAQQGRDKVTILASPDIYDIGAWLEQLIAESTGKIGKGLIPVDQEPVGSPESYGNDRIFAYLRLTAKPDAAQDAAVEKLEAAGHPVVRIAVTNIAQIGQEFFRWEMAIPVAGEIIGIDPFDQPDVEASKVETRKLTDQYEQEGKLPAETPILEDGGIKLYSDEKNAAALNAKGRSAADVIAAHLGRLAAGDYAALLAYIDRDKEHLAELERLRTKIRDGWRVATCVGFGPRFLHSTGQAYKGGPNSGVFLQLTCDDPDDLPVPDQKYSFGTVKAAQARGDFQVLVDRGRRALRIHLGSDIAAGLKTIEKAIEQALSAKTPSQPRAAE